MISERLGRMRPRIPDLWPHLLIAAYIMAALNVGFWRRLVAIFGTSPGQALLFALAILGLTVLVLALFGPGRLQKTAAMALILIAAAASHFGRGPGVLIDREMIRNVFETTRIESRHLAAPGSVTVIPVTGVLPAALVFWSRIARIRRRHHLWRWPLGVTAGCGGVDPAQAQTVRGLGDSATKR